MIRRVDAHGAVRMMASMRASVPRKLAQPTRRRGTLWTTLAAGALTIAVLALFLPTLRFEFINYDVYDQLIDNPLVRSLAPDNIYRIFTRLSTTSYYPIRLLSFAIDYAIWELNPKGYHLTNVLIHLANVLLLFVLALRLGRCIRGDRPDTASVVVNAPQIAAFAAAALLAVHPVVVEPVCWQGAREELLMMMFCLLCVHAHISLRPPVHTATAIRSGSRTVGLHVLSGVFCAFACMSSALGAAVPLIVTGYDAATGSRNRFHRLLMGTWYLWLIGIATVMVKIMTHQVELSYAGPTLTAAERVRVVFATYAENLHTLFWPGELTLLYPHAVPPSLLSPIVLTGIASAIATLVLVWLARRERCAMFGLLWFLFALAPSAQVLPHQHFRADRFLYAPLAGLALAVGAGLLLLLIRRRVPPAAVLAGFAVIGGALAFRTTIQSRVWRNNVTLFTHCIEVHPTALAYNNRGTTYGRLERYDDAIADFTRSMELVPDTAATYHNRGQARLLARQFDEAIEDFTRALALAPANAATYDNRARANFHAGLPDLARRDAQQAARLDPDGPAGRSARTFIAWLDQHGL